MRLRSHEIHAFVGKRGSGKSTRAKELCQRLMDAGQRVVAFDPHDEYSEHGRASKQVRLGPLSQRMTMLELCEDESILDEPGLALAVVPEGDPRELAKSVHELSEMVRDTGRVVLLLEELGMYGEFAADTLNELACQSRHDEVPLVFVAQRMVQVPKTARTQISTLNSGRQDDPADLRALADVAGPHFADAVALLGAGESLAWSDTDWTAPKSTAVPPRKEAKP